MAPKKQTKKADENPRMPPEKTSLKAQILHSKSVAVAMASTYYLKQKEIAEGLVEFADGNYEEALKDAKMKMRTRTRDRDAARVAWEDCGGDAVAKAEKLTIYERALSSATESIKDVMALRDWWEREGKTKADEAKANKTDAEKRLEFQLEQKRRTLHYDGITYMDAERELKDAEFKMRVATRKVDSARARLERTRGRLELARSGVASVEAELAEERARKLSDK
jgi:hypothetical protein